MLSGEATNNNFIVFGLTRLVLDPKIYRSQGEHPNHYATDAVTMQDEFLEWQYFSYIMMISSEAGGKKSLTNFII